jgi:RNA polymerase sigma-70 factor (ECF subfamily)
MTDWSRIVQEYGPIVQRTVYRLLNDEADVGGCFQDAFVAALKLSRAQPVRNWPGLLKRLATARALDRLRQRCREGPQMSQLPEGLEVAATAAEPQQAAESAELADCLRRALAEIDTRQAEVFCLACLEELDYRHIAEQLGVTVNNVGVLLNRAKASLRERMRAFAPTTSAERRQREVRP